MKRTLGLDLGTNSIGWAISENDSIKELGVRIIPSKRTPSREVTLTRPLTNRLTLSTTEKATLAVLAITIGLTAIDLANWQFWLGLGMATLLTFLSMRKK